VHAWCGGARLGPCTLVIVWRPGVLQGTERFKEAQGDVAVHGILANQQRHLLPQDGHVEGPVVPWRVRRAVAADLRAIYGATTLTTAEQAWERFADRWAPKYPAISPSWLADWDRLTVFFDYPPAIRRAIYTTNAIESLNYSLRKVLKGRSAFPNDESIIKVLYMGLQHVAKKWTQPIPEWKAALNQFVILFGDRMPV